MERYEIKEKIGEGEFGITYKAIDLKSKITYALKLLREDLLEDKEVFQRFNREIQLLQDANKSDHLVQYFDHGVAKLSNNVNLPYYVMEFVEGDSLAKKYYIKTKNKEQKIIKKPPFQKAVSTILQISMALVDLHKKGIIHRDIKPENIMISDNRAVLIDLGLALKLNTQHRLTQTGTLLGTLKYMSPEIFFQGASKASEKADIYSLGVIFFELLTGTRPFPNEEKMPFDTILKINQVPAFPKNINANTTNCCSAMLKWLPQERPNSSQTVNHLNSLFKEN